MWSGVVFQTDSKGVYKSDDIWKRNKECKEETENNDGLKNKKIVDVEKYSNVGILTKHMRKRNI